MTQIAIGTPTTEDDEHLAALFRDIKKGQLELLDSAAKRLIELDTGLLGILFAIIAFGPRFPPAYLQGNGFAKLMLIIAITCYLATTWFALRVMQPRSYSVNPHSLTDMRAKLDEIIAVKSKALRPAGILFFCATVALVLLIGGLVASV